MEALWGNHAFSTYKFCLNSFPESNLVVLQKVVETNYQIVQN